MPTTTVAQLMSDMYMILRMWSVSKVARSLSKEWWMPHGSDSAWVIIGSRTQSNRAEDAYGSGSPYEWFVYAFTYVVCACFYASGVMGVS